MAQQKISRPMITAELRQWQRNATSVKGIIHNSNSSDYLDGETRVFLNYKYINTYPDGPDGGGVYYLMRINLGLYFKMFESEHNDAAPMD